MASYTDYLSMGNYNYEPLTQRQAIPNWQTQYAPKQVSFPVASGGTAVMGPSPVVPKFGVGGAYGPDNIDVGGGFNPGMGSPAADKGWSWLGTREQPGVAGLAIGGVQALGGLYLGMQQYNQAKDALAFQKDSFNKQFEVQKNLTNSQLEDRQKARVAANPGAYQSVGNYMNQYGVK